ncbi:MAG: GerMN domain-containing protein [Pyrinomonadaceae bacterium]
MMMKIKLLFASLILLSSFNPLDARETRAQQNPAPDVREVFLYFPKDGESGNSHKNPFNLQAVTRKVSPEAPLRPTLEALLAGVTDEEANQGFRPLDTEGMRIVGLMIKSRTAYASFAHRKGAGWGGDLSPATFRYAVERTIRQFPSVRRVRLCVDGAENFDTLESGERVRKCQ